MIDVAISRLVAAAIQIRLQARPKKRPTVTPLAHASTMPNPVVPFFRSLNVKAPGGLDPAAFWPLRLST